MIKRSPKAIPAHYGILDYYKYYKKNCDNPIDKKLYSKIINDFNLSVIDGMLNNKLEYYIIDLGVFLNIRKDKRQPRIVDGKLYHNAPIDWVSTNKLWNNDSEAKEKKLLVRYLNNLTSGYVYRIYMSKYNYLYKNKKYYKFKPSRLFQRSLAKRIKDFSKEKFDAFLLYKKK